MMTQEEILAITDSIIQKWKPFDPINKKPKAFTDTGQLNIPEYFPNYREMVEQYEAIKVHSTNNVFPDRLFLNAAPNQTEKEFAYMKSIYKQTTLPVFLDLMSTLQRPLNDKNWSIKYKEDSSSYVQAEKTLEKYVETEIKYYGGLENYFKNVVPAIQTIDANGVIAVKPCHIPVIQNEEGEVTMDSQELIEPIPYYYPITKLRAWEEGRYCFVELDEKSEVDYGGSKKKIGKIYEAYDDTNIYHIKQKGKYIDFEFEIIIYYSHEWGKVPVIKNGGIPIIKDCHLLYQSPFLFAVPLLDNVAINNTYLQVSINSCVYPHKVMIGSVCSFEDNNGSKCTDGQIWNKDLKGGAGAFYTCPSCNGVGLKDRTSRLGVLLLNPATRTDDGDSTFKHSPLEFISPEIDSLRFLEEKCEKDLQKARQILHLQTSNSEVKGSEDMTATGMVLDLKSLYAFIQPQIYNLFRKWEFVLEAIGYMRYGDDFQKPVFNYPQNFDFVTEEEVMVQLSNAIKAGLPPLLLRIYMERFLRAMYFNEQETGKILDLIIATDRLLPFNNEDILLKQAKGTIEQWEVIIHDSAIDFIRELIAEDSTFMSLTLEEQKKKLVDKSKAKLLLMESERRAKTEAVIEDVAGEKVT
jgi:hypothetical protein